MKKESWILSLIGLFLIFSINLVNAFNGYSGIGLTDFFYIFDPSTIILGLIFLVCFAAINSSLNKVFRGNAAVAGIVSFCISLGIVYGIWWQGLDFETIFFDMESQLILFSQ